MKDLSYFDKLSFIKRVELRGQRGDNYNGAFITKIDGRGYGIIASNGGGWEHVSVSNGHHIPSWKVMSTVKDLFFEEWETVMQLHPAKQDYVNDHNNCLHLWRPLNERIPLPPKIFV